MPANPSTGTIKRIKRSATLSEQVTSRLETLIIDSELSAGDRLMTERELAERFDVSRTVVREAVRGLVSKGVLQVNPGSGTVIRRPSADLVSQTMSHYLRLGDGGLDHDKITEVRRLLEVEIAGLAAERRTADDLERLKAILQGFDKVRDDKAAYSRWDVSFHLQIASATKNELLRLLLDSISGIMTKVRELGFGVAGSSDRAFRFHEDIFRQIGARNPERARKAMRAHIDDSERIMTEALASQPARSGSGK